MLSMLIAYDATGNVIATLDYLVQYAADGAPIGLADFEVHEAAGGDMTDIWNVAGAKGSKVWPEWLGGAAHDFMVDLVGPPGRKRIAALIHKTSGHRRVRVGIEAAIADRITKAKGGPADIRDLVGGPDRPMHLDDMGKTIKAVHESKGGTV